MNRLKNLDRLSTYLKGFRLAGASCGYMYVTAQADATTRLDKASGDQVVIARPEVRQGGFGQDNYREDFDTAVFVLAKDLGAARTDEAEETQYSRLMGLADAVLAKIDADCTGGCGLMSGFEISDVQVVPETFLFGGWCGFSMSIGFRR